MRGRRISIALNIVTLFEQIDRALTLSANQFAGRSLVLDQFVNNIVYLPLLTGGVFMSAFCWLWFNAVVFLPADPSRESGGGFP
jgi:hypothetical protein